MHATCDAPSPSSSSSRAPSTSALDDSHHHHHHHCHDSNDVISHHHVSSSSLGEDVNAVMTSYVAALAAKDDDILRLYDDNKRLRALVERAMAEKERVDAQYCDELRRVSVLQSELHGKHAAAAACAVQRRMLSAAFAQLATLFSLPQPPQQQQQHRQQQDDASPQRALTCAASSDACADAEAEWQAQAVHDVVAAVKSLCAQLRDAHDACTRDAARVARLQRWSHAVLLASEAHARKLLRELRTVVSNVLYATTRDTRALLSRVSALEAALRASQQATHDAEARVCALQTQRADDERRQQQQQQLQLVQQQECLEAAQRARADADAALLAAQARQHEQQQQQQQRERDTLYATATHAVIDLLARRCLGAEAAWARTLLTLTRASTTSTTTVTSAASAATAAAAQREREVHALEADVRALQRLQQSQSQQRVAAVQARYDELNAQHATLQREHAQLREKHAAVAARAQSARQRSTQTVQRLTSELACAHERVAALTRRVDVLEGRLCAAVSDAAAQQRRDAAAARAQEQQQRQQQLQLQQQLHACAAREARLRVAHIEATERTALQAGELACRVHLLQSAHDAVVQAARRQRDAASALRRELHEWATLCTTLQHRVARVTRQHAREQQARRLLERQHVCETHMLRRLLTTQAHDEQHKQQQQEQQQEPRLLCAAPDKTTRGSSDSSDSDSSSDDDDVDDSTRNVADASTRVRLLEEACRSSAAVIAQLRAELHRRAHVSLPLPPTHDDDDDDGVAVHVDAASLLLGL